MLQVLQQLCRFVCWGWGKGPELWGCAVLIPSVSSWVLRTWLGSQPHPSLPRDPLQDTWGGMPTSWVMGPWRFPAHSRSWAGWEGVGVGFAGSRWHLSRQESPCATGRALGSRDFGSASFSSTRSTVPQPSHPLLTAPGSPPGADLARYCLPKPPRFPHLWSFALRGHAPSMCSADGALRAVFALKMGLKMPCLLLAGSSTSSSPPSLVSCAQIRARPRAAAN